MEMTQKGQDLATLVEMSGGLKQVFKVDLHVGDCMIVQTCNSTYTLRVLDAGWFEIAGGWFDRKGKSPATVRINGCTWGGSAIKLNIAAACGMCLEFGNRVVTTPVQKIFVLQNGALN